MTTRRIASGIFFILVLSSLCAIGIDEQPDRLEPEDRYGGVLRIGTQSVGTLDPHFATSIADIQLHSQVYEYLTSIDASNRPVPDLATGWESGDGKTWIFTLRSEARFSDGQPVTAHDAVFSFNRLRDPAVGTPTVDLYRNIREVRVLDQHRIQFLLFEANPEFAVDVGDYHAAIIPAGIREPAQEPVGSGPFMIDRHHPGEVVLKRNPHYDRKDAHGGSLPYLDGIRLVPGARMDKQVDAMLDGSLDFIGGLSFGMVKRLRGVRTVRIVTVDANMHWVIRMRSDPGHPTADNRVRKALKLATRHQALVNAIRPRLASVGNGFTPVGPAYGMYHLVRPPFPDLPRARRLLAEAGYGDGLRIILYVQNQHDAVAIASAWKQQVAQIGVEVDTRIVPQHEYYGNGENNWLTAEFGVTEWGDRVTPVTYFKLAYQSDAPWNETHWSDPEFDGIIRAIDSEMNESRRIHLYHEAQEILIERGPIIVPYFVRAVAGVRSGLRGIVLASDWPRTRFRDVWIAK